MIAAYSRLQKILEQRRLTVPELHRRLQQQDQGVNIKSLYRLNDAHQPLARLDLPWPERSANYVMSTLADLVDFRRKGRSSRHWRPTSRTGSTH